MCGCSAWYSGVRLKSYAYAIACPTLVSQASHIPLLTVDEKLKFTYLRTFLNDEELLIQAKAGFLSFKNIVTVLFSPAVL